MIDLLIGTIVISKGKHGIVEEAVGTEVSCLDCMFYPNEYNSSCLAFCCDSCEREDGKTVIIRERLKDD